MRSVLNESLRREPMGLEIRGEPGQPPELKFGQLTRTTASRGAARLG